MSVKTQLLMRVAGSNDNFAFVSGVDSLKPPGIKNHFETVLEMGGDGRIESQPTGVSEVTTPELDLYWKTEWRDNLKDEQHVALKHGANSNTLFEFRVIYDTGLWSTFEAYIEEFQPETPKDKKDRAKIKLRPKKDWTI